MTNLFKIGGLVCILSTLTYCKTSEMSSSTLLSESKIEKVISNKDFEMQMQWANPLNTMALNSVLQSGLFLPGNNGSQINLIGNGNYFRMQGDTISAYLPFYGERRLGGGFGRNAQIEFKDVVQDLEVRQNNKKKRFELKFSINDMNHPNENYQVYLELYANKRGILNINSSDRTVISYSGTIKSKNFTHFEDE